MAYVICSIALNHSRGKESALLSKADVLLTCLNDCYDRTPDQATFSAITVSWCAAYQRPLPVAVIDLLEMVVYINSVAVGQL